MKNTAKSLKRALALMLAVLMLSSCFVFSAFAADKVTLKAEQNQAENQIDVTPELAEGVEIDTISYSVTANPTSGAPTKENVVGTDNTCALQGLTKGTEYTITATGTLKGGESFSATVTQKLDKYTQDAPAAVYATEITRTSVTVNAIAGAEYSIDAWENTHEAGSENANVFEGLDENKTYTVEVRMPETADYSASKSASCVVTPSKGVTVVNKASGSLKINAVSYPGTGIIVNSFGKALDSISSTPALDKKETAAGEYTLYTTVADTVYTVTAKAGTDTVEFTIEALAADAKAEVAAPKDIVVESIDTSSIEVTKVEGVEYACLPSTEELKEDTAFSDANKFTGLTENTEYTVYARYAATEDNYASEVVSVKATPCSSSIVYTVDTEKNCIKIEAKFPASDSVKEIAVAPESTPAISVVNEVKESGSYKCDIYNVVPGTQYTVTITLESGKTLEAKALIKKTQAAPAAPTLSSRTKNSIVINAVKGNEYVCVAHGKEIPVSGWVTATAATVTFDELTDGTVYDIYARLPETEIAQVSPASAALSVTTIKASENIAAKDVTFANVSKTEITITKLAGYEYKLYIDGKDSEAKWQDSNKFTGLKADTIYYAVQRVKVDETVQEVNPTSAAKKIKTNSGDPYIIDTASLETFTLSTDNGSFEITAKAAKKSTTDKQWGDIQYIPSKYTIKKDNTVVKEGSFTTKDNTTYTASGSVSDAGDYTVIVTFEKQRYEAEGTSGFVPVEFVTQQKTFNVVNKFVYNMNKALSFLGTTMPQYMMKFFNWLRDNWDNIMKAFNVIIGANTDV